MENQPIIASPQTAWYTDALLHSECFSSQEEYETYKKQYYEQRMCDPIYIDIDLKALVSLEKFFSEDPSRRNVGVRPLPSVYCDNHKDWEVEDNSNHCDCCYRDEAEYQPRENCQDCNNLSELNETIEKNMMYLNLKARYE